MFAVIAIGVINVIILLFCRKSDKPVHPVARDEKLTTQFMSQVMAVALQNSQALSEAQSALIEKLTQELKAKEDLLYRLLQETKIANEDISNVELN